jgi:N-acyl-phosphatidylethanolamine-hydrolysing phospholipase D
MRITMIGHCTTLIETASGQRILTDPFFSTWGNPAYGRLAPPARTRQELLDVDLVLISHNHFDHADGRFLRMLPKTTPVVNPRLVSGMTWLLGAHNLVRLNTWETWMLGETKITAVPATHLTVTHGYGIEADGQVIYFAGDTFYGKHMAQISERLHPQVAMIPVTTYRIPMTMGEKQAVQAAIDLQAQVIIPIHQSLGPRSPLLRTRDTPEGFRKRLQERGSLAQVVILKEGETWEEK